jgi:hypothetical protein
MILKIVLALSMRIIAIVLLSALAYTAVAGQTALQKLIDTEYALRLQPCWNCDRILRFLADDGIVEPAAVKRQKSLDRKERIARVAFLV